ncbi:MAG: hypothetical protein HAW66_07640 [Shewanella sp.]|nr:hypothetical protein [Shewanella sp.]
MLKKTLSISISIILGSIVLQANAASVFDSLNNESKAPANKIPTQPVNNPSGKLFNDLESNFTGSQPSTNIINTRGTTPSLIGNDSGKVMTGLNVFISNCQASLNNKASADNLMMINFSTQGGVKVNNNGMQTFVFGHKFDNLHQDLTEHYGVSTIHVGTITSDVVIKMTDAAYDQPNLPGIADFYQFTCDNNTSVRPVYSN